MSIEIIGGASPTGHIGGVIGQGVFDGGNAPSAQMWYEALEPPLGWAVERWPGKPFTYGRAHRGLVMIGPAMGDNGTTEAAGILAGGLFVPAVIGAVAVALYFLFKEGGGQASRIFHRNPSRDDSPQAAFMRGYYTGLKAGE